MTQDETLVRSRSARALALLALPVLAFAYGCGSHAPSDLFSSTTLGASGSPTSSDGGTTNLGSGGSTSAGAGAGGSDPVGSAGKSSDGGSLGMPVGGAPNAGGSASAGAGAGGSPSSVGGASGSSGAPSNLGGSGGTGPIVTGACASRLVQPPALVADFEQGVAGWLGYTDNNPALVVSIQPGAHGTQHAADFSGGAAKISGMYFQMPCRDVSEFDGIAFWGKSDGNSHVRFLAVIPATDPTANIGDCDPMQEVCSDHPGKAFVFSSEWTQYYAAWSDLKQLGFGAKASFGGVINALLWINDGPVDHFDFAIDEVSFYQGDPSEN